VHKSAKSLAILLRRKYKLYRMLVLCQGLPSFAHHASPNIPVNMQMISISPAVLSLLQFEFLNSPLSADVQGILYGQVNRTDRTEINDNTEIKVTSNVISVNAYSIMDRFYAADGSLLETATIEKDSSMPDLR
jgi:hypothetical protein